MRAAPPPLSSYPWQSSHDLRFGDTDKIGHVNNGAFGSLMESNRSLLFSRIREESQSEAERAETTTVIARFEIDYLKELHWPGTVIAACGIERIGGASFVLRQALFSDGACAALARSTVVIMDRATRRARPVPDRMRAAFQRWSVT